MTDLDLQWFLLALPVAFAFGWIASRLDLRQVRGEHRDTPRAYFKGLNLLLNEQQDKAVDAFIEAVQNDPDTAELHFALGNLFRRRGEVERAVRVHEHLLARADLKTADRQRAQYALAQDFMRAGLFDRAEEAYQKLDGTPFEGESWLALLTLHERSRGWAAAISTATRLEQAGRGSFATRIAHYECELALQADAQGRAADAAAALQRARTAAPAAARPLALIGARALKAGDAAAALAAWDELRRVQPASFGLIALDYAGAARECARDSTSDGASDHASDPANDCAHEDQARSTLDALYAQAPSMALLRARSALDTHTGDLNTRLAAHLQSAPSLAAAQALLRQPPQAWGEAGLAGIRNAVDRAAEPLQRYRCAACGFEAQHYFWQCPGCLSWDSFPPQPIEEL